MIWASSEMRNQPILHEMRNYTRSIQIAWINQEMIKFDISIFFFITKLHKNDKNPDYSFFWYKLILIQVYEKFLSSYSCRKWALIRPLTEVTKKV